MLYRPFVAKIILCGDSKTGKSALRNRVINDKFTDEYLHEKGRCESEMKDI